MACPECEKNKKKTAKDFTKAVVEIKNPDKLVLFRKVVVPASMGTEEQFPASVGKFSNVLLQYEANGDTYLYSSDGIPTQLSSDVSELQRQLDELKIVVTNEIADRIAADGTINSRIDQEILDRQAADNDLSDALAAEVAARKAADNTLDGKITTEKNARIAADNTLQTNINNEATARAAADSTLDGKITTEKEAREAADQTLQTNINNEATTRANADTALGTRITNETTARQNADNTLDGKITTEANTRSAADSALAEDISAEVTRAKAAETALGGRIDDEATARAAADTTLDGKITTEATARANADSTLDGKITDEATARANADTALGTRITNETTARTNADTALGTRIDNEATARANADTAIESKLNRNVLYDLEMETDANNVTFVEDKINLKTGATTTERDVIPAASTTTAGTISASEYISLVDAEEKITALLEGAVAIDNLPANPTQQQLTDAWLAATGKDELINRASIYDSANQLVHTYYTNVSEWEDSPAGGQITIDQFTNNAAGIIKGSTTDGNVSANLDGTGTVSGWTALKNTVAGKQDALTAGNNISISGSTISATDTTYSAGTGLSLTGTTFAVDTTTIAQKSDIPTVNNATLTIQKNGTTVKTFTANASTNVTANITVPTKTSDLTNDSNFPVDANYVHTDNNFTTALKNKLDGIAAGAEVNQNAFSNVKVGGTTVAADSKTDTLELVAGSNVTLTPDATNDKVTIAATDTNTTYTFANGTNGFTVTPSGGSAQTVTVTPSIANATTSAAGLMSAADKTKLNGIASGAEVNVQSDWSVTDTSSDAFIKNKPTIPTVNNATLTIQKNGTNVQTFTANSSTNKTANITVPTKVTDLTDAANYVAKDGDFYATGEGSNFSMTGTSQNVYADLRVKGDTQQTTYTGKNLNNGVSQGYFINTAATGCGKTDNDSGVAIAVQANTNYTVSTTTTQARYRVAAVSALPTSSATVAAYNGVNKDNKSESITINSGSYTYLVVNATNLSAIQVEAGSTATSFEPYVGGAAAPNPDYPQEVEVVTGRQAITSMGKNLYKTPASTTNNGVKYTLNPDGTYDIKGTATAQANAIIYDDDLSKFTNGATYTLSCNKSSLPSYVRILCEGYNGSTWVRHAITGGGASYLSGSTVQITGTLDLSGCNRLRFVLRVDNGNTVALSGLGVQLEKGSTATPFEPYLGKEMPVWLNAGINYWNNLQSGFLPLSGAYPTENPSYPNAKYRLVTLKPGQSIQTIFTGSDNGSGRVRWINPTTNEVVGVVNNGDYEYYSSTHNFGDGFYDAIITAHKDVIIGFLDIGYGYTQADFKIEPINFDGIELCKLGDYQDYIYPSGGKWYLHKETGKETLPTSGYTLWPTHSEACIYYMNSVPTGAYFANGVSSGFSKQFVTSPQVNSVTDYYNAHLQTKYSLGLKYGTPGVVIQNKEITTLADFHTWITNNPVTLYYPLATATDTEITNPLLVAQLDDLWRNLQSGTNTTNVNVEGDLPAILGVTAFTNTLASAMAGINERMNRLPAIPQITMTTTDPGEGQTLADNHYIAVYE